MGVATAMVRVGPHELAANVFGDGDPAVVIEPAFGGDAAAWRPFAEEIAQDTKVITYDRVPYGASSAATDRRTARDVARDLHGVLQGLGITGPLVLVGHSVGGVYIRAYAAEHPGAVAGMVLVESSHEGQRKATRGKTPWKWRMMDFCTIPTILRSPVDVGHGADRRSLIKEFRSFLRMTEADRALAPGCLGRKPLIVLTRREDPAFARSGFWPVWRDLQADLARLSANSRHVISASPDHYLNDADPELVACAIRQVVRSARTCEPLEGMAVSGGCREEAANLAAPTVGGAARVRDHRRERRDHQRDRRHHDRRHGGEPVHHQPGDRAQSDARAHHHEVDGLRAA